MPKKLMPVAERRQETTGDVATPPSGRQWITGQIPDSPGPEGVADVGSDSIQAGSMQAEWLAEQLGGKGNVVIMNGDLAQEAAQKRTEGEKQVFATFPDIQIIKEDTANWDRAQGLASRR